jgi:hypothetical protein
MSGRTCRPRRCNLKPCRSCANKFRFWIIHGRFVRCAVLSGAQAAWDGCLTHPPGGHDDYANALAGCLRVAHARPNKVYWATYAGGF